MFRKDRKITLSHFKRCYLPHGLTGYLTKGIIWNFHKPNKTVSAVYLNNRWVNSNNEILDVYDAEAVSLWRPAQSSVEKIKAWGLFLVLHHLQQPLKQAFTEVR